MKADEMLDMDGLFIPVVNVLWRLNLILERTLQTCTKLVCASFDSSIHSITRFFYYEM